VRQQTELETGQGEKRMSDFYVSWDEYNRSVEKLCVAVRDSGWEFNQIVCIARG